MLRLDHRPACVLIVANRLPQRLDEEVEISQRYRDICSRHSCEQPDWQIQLTRLIQGVDVAFRNESVFVSPDMYIFAPGGGRYVEAANGFMANQLLFGTSYPFRPLAQSVQDFRALGFTSGTAVKAMFHNPSRLFGLG